MLCLCLLVAMFYAQGIVSSGTGNGIVQSGSIEIPFVTCSWDTTDSSLVGVTLYDTQDDWNIFVYVRMQDKMCFKNGTVSGSCVFNASLSMVTLKLLVELKEGETRTYGCNATWSATGTDTSSVQKFIVVTRNRTELVSVKQQDRCLPGLSYPKVIGIAVGSGLASIAITVTVMCLWNVYRQTDRNSHLTDGGNEVAVYTQTDRNSHLTNGGNKETGRRQTDRDSLLTDGGNEVAGRRQTVRDSDMTNGGNEVAVYRQTDRNSHLTNGGNKEIAYTQTDRNSPLTDGGNEVAGKNGVSVYLVRQDSESFHSTRSRPVSTTSSQDPSRIREVDAADERLLAPYRPDTEVDEKDGLDQGI